MIRSRCGLDCEICENRKELDCPGCMSLEEGNWAGDCDVKQCCEESQLEHCGLCPWFPCDLLRNTAFDPDEGDDGERLITLKQWAEETAEPRESGVNRIVIGAASGIAVGAVMGAFSGNLVPVLIAGTLAGTAIGVMLNVFKGDR